MRVLMRISESTLPFQEGYHVACFHLPFVQEELIANLNTFVGITPPEGAIISGQFVPGNMIVSILQWSAFRSATNYKDANSFIPERWLRASSDKTGDKLDAIFPFSLGPRTCIAKE